MWEHAMWMRGYEQFFMDMVMNKEMVHAIMSKILEIKIKYLGKALETVGENVMVVSCADDLGGQKGLLVSLDMYKELIWPYHKKLFEFIKKKAESKVNIFFHKDGAIYGDNQLKNVFEQCADQSTTEIRDCILKSLDNYTTQDDVTMMVVKKN